MTDRQQTSLERLVLAVSATVMSAGIIWGANELSQLGEQMARMETKMEPVHTTIRDHEQRIRRLERAE